MHFESAQFSSCLTNKLQGLDDFNKGHGNSVTRRGWFPSKLLDKVAVGRPDGIGTHAPAVNDRHVHDKLGAEDALQTSGKSTSSRVGERESISCQQVWDGAWRIFYQALQTDCNDATVHILSH